MANNNNNKRSVKDHAYPNIGDFMPSITRPRVEANNFELKPALCQMVQQSQFGGNPSESPHVHLAHFLEISDMLKINGVSDDAIRLRLFPFSLKDRAREWLHSLPPGSITTWDELCQAFLAQYFPPSKTAKLRNELTSFKPRDDESLYEAWERYKDLQRRCPHHGIPTWMLVQNFYNGVSPAIRSTIDASSGGDLMEKSEDEAFSALDKIAYNNYQWSCERNEIKKLAGMFELDAMNMINAKFDALTRKMDKLSMKVDSSAGGSSNSVEVGAANVNCAADFSALNQDFSSEQVDYVGNYNQRPGGNSFSATYDPAWRNHPNFSWGGRQGHNQNFQQPSGYQQNWNFQQNRAQQASSSSNKAFGKLPSQPENSREHCKAITLRSGKILENGDKKIKEKIEEEKNREGDEQTEVEVRIGAEKENSVEEKGSKERESKEEEPKYVTPKAYMPPLPFPQRFQKAKLDKQFGKFLEVLKSLHVTIPFTDALAQMPSYAKFLKEILSNKKKLEEFETVALTEESSAILQNKLPPKLKDPGSFCNTLPVATPYILLFR
ncbi:hypothetical protein P3X46_007162 [Hevea brasiliensis]|uniref:Retrotransposon gag domain-containing protein n=1 Tax=Hevea brasiliensis TaxID=3981 RepID=A0ABQ9MUM3_HEVBR|nr:hypothetical protein P3X46_007162 [Hevea brasiliensis]